MDPPAFSETNRRTPWMKYVKFTVNGALFGFDSSFPCVGAAKIGTPSTPSPTAVTVVTGMWNVPASCAASAASIWRLIEPLMPPNWPKAVFMWEASLSFIQAGTYWFTMRLMNVRKTRRDMIEQTDEKTQTSTPTHRQT